MCCHTWEQPHENLRSFLDNYVAEPLDGCPVDILMHLRNSVSFSCPAQALQAAGRGPVPEERVCSDTVYAACLMEPVAPMPVNVCASLAPAPSFPRSLAPQLAHLATAMHQQIGPCASPCSHTVLCTCLAGRPAPQNAGCSCNHTGFHVFWATPRPLLAQAALVIAHLAHWACMNFHTPPT